MSIKDLKIKRNEYCKYTNPNNWQAGIQNYMTEVINTFEAQSDVINKLENKVKELEQEGSYYPRTEKEIKNIKLGGTD